MRNRAITSSEPWNTERNKVDRNAPITSKHVFPKRSTKMIDGTEKPKIPSKFAKCAARYNEFGYNSSNDTLIIDCFSSMRKLITTPRGKQFLWQIEKVLCYPTILSCCIKCRRSYSDCSLIELYRTQSTLIEPVSIKHGLGIKCGLESTDWVLNADYGLCV